MLFLTAFLYMQPIVAQKPQWVNNTPKELHDSYQFIQVVAYGEDIDAARGAALQQLAQNEQLSKAVNVNVETGRLRHVEQHLHSGRLDETITDNMDVEMTVKGQTFNLQAKVVDEYVEKADYGKIKLTILYMVAVTSQPVFDKTTISENYGIAPAAMSILPGAGQWYKGQKTKGTLLFLGTVASATGIIFCENQRASYHKKMKEQPQFAKTYNTKSSNWETARNICIGATAAIYAYNLIDAAVAKGARRIIVGNKGQHLSLRPIKTPDATGVALSYTF